MLKPEKLLTKKQIKEIFREYGLPLVKTVDDRNFKDKIPHRKFGGTVRFRESDVYEFVRRQLGE